MIEQEDSKARLVCRWVKERFVTYVPSEPPELPYWLSVSVDDLCTFGCALDRAGALVRT